MPPYWFLQRPSLAPPLTPHWLSDVISIETLIMAAKLKGFHRRVVEFPLRCRDLLGGFERQSVEASNNNKWYWVNNGYCLTLLTDFYERANWRQFQTLHSSEIVLGIHEFFGLSNVWAELVSSEVPMPNRCHGCFQAWPTVMVCVINSALANSLGGGFQYHMLPWVRTQEVCVGGWRRSRNAADFSNDFRVKWRQSSQQQKGTSGGLSSVVAFCVRGFGPLIRWHFRHSAEKWRRTDWCRKPEEAVSA